MYRFVLVAFALVISTGCQKPTAPTEQGGGESAATTEEAPKTSAPIKVDGARARELVKGGATLLDVRTQSEFDGGHIEGAKLIPVQELGSRLGDVGPKDKPVVVYCASGVRSGRAAGQLAEAGFTQVYDLGSIRSW
jgi:rhodanese-related sulfurtransferase